MNTTGDPPKPPGGPNPSIDRIVRLQKRKSRSLAATGARERIAKLRKLLEALHVHRQDILQALQADLGKSPEEVLLTEVYPLSSEIKFVSRRLHRWMQPRRVRSPLAYFGARSEIHYQPKGVVLIISPWNFPFQLALGPLISAVAAGNCSVLKPSELSPHTTRLLARLLGRVFDESEVAVVKGGKEVAQALLKRPFDHVFFTGSSVVGRKVMAAASQHLASVTLELGGKSPVLIEETANLKRAAQRISWGKFLNAGQTCVAPDYVLVPAAQVDAFVEEVRRAVENSYGDLNEIDQNPDYGRIINTRHFQRLESLLSDALQRGAQKPLGGVAQLEQRFIPPTIVSSPDLESELMNEEIFGPILAVLPYERLEEALALINARPSPLALYIFSRNPQAIERILRVTQAGDTVINDVVIHFANPALPFGGVGKSGMGKAHGRAGFEAFSHARSVMYQSRVSATWWLKPPYSNRLKRLIDWMIKYF